MIMKLISMFQKYFQVKKDSKAVTGVEPQLIRYSIDHFRHALIDLSDLHYDDLAEILYMAPAARIYLTAGVGIRFSSKRVKCSWAAWYVESFTADGICCEEIGDDFTSGELLIKSRDGKNISIAYKNSGIHGDAYLDSEHLFGWSA